MVGSFLPLTYILNVHTHLQRKTMKAHRENILIFNFRIIDDFRVLKVANSG